MLALRSQLAAQERNSMCFHAHVTEQLELRETVALLDAAVGDLNLDAVMVGGDSGVTLADELSDTLGLRTNGTLPEGSRRLCGAHSSAPP